MIGVVQVPVLALWELTDGESVLLKNNSSNRRHTLMKVKETVVDASKDIEAISLAFVGCTGFSGEHFETRFGLLPSEIIDKIALVLRVVLKPEHKVDVRRVII
jgi:hypothetical protein